MVTNPHITSRLAGQRQRDILADAQHHGLTRRLRGQPAATQHRERPGRRLRRALRAAARLRRLAAVVAAVTCALVAVGAAAPAAPAALAGVIPQPGPLSRFEPTMVVPAQHHTPVPVHSHAALTVGMPGWQITLIAVGAAILAAAVAVLLDRARSARRLPTTTAA